MTENAMQLPQHVAIIMDGNNRYAKKLGLPKGEGHRLGKKQLDPIVEHARKIGIKALTVFAFSSENWNRPPDEVALLMALFEQTIQEQLLRMHTYKIAMRFIGNRQQLSHSLQQWMQKAEQETAHYESMTLVIAVSYGGQWDIVQAAKYAYEHAQKLGISFNEMDVNFFAKYLSLSDLPPVDLLIRTGGDYRISNFLLWQCAYAEFYFTETLWPAFSPQELDEAIEVFNGRERRFGKTSEQISALKN